METPVTNENPTPVVNGQEIAGAAGVIALGNVLSRIMGLARDVVTAHLFGASGLVSAYGVASKVPTYLYDLLVGGMVSSALVPVFSEHASPQRREELWRIASLMLTLTVVVLAAVTLVLEVGAPWLAWLLAGGWDADLLAATTRLLRLTLPAVIFLGLSGMITGLLYALKRFSYPAFTMVAFNTSIVVCGLAFARHWNIASLAVGLVVGATLQVALQLPGLRDMRFRPRLDLRDPALRRIIRLYLPIVLGLVISQVGIIIDRNLASRTGEESIAWMNYATTLIQFPLGLVSVAIATAILPTLSQQAAANRESVADFNSTLALGLRLVLALIVPATIGLFVLAHPVIALLFQRGEFDARDTMMTALALRYYLLGLTFAAVDQPLVFAFYARKDTLTPALVGLLGVGFYLVVALALIRPLGMVGLILANGAQLSGHAVVMLILFWRRVGSLRGQGLGVTLLKTGVASAVMAGATLLILQGLSNVTNSQTLLGRLILVGGAGSAGVAVYLGLCALLRLREMGLLFNVVIRRLRGSE
ncbi:MAG: murein biosynthesis integral membrane protein MurJ [Anaerolineae bacterium]|nr:murein biosynthesis integral membrane protein MurJ [Anaerolineae bacterium]MDH7475620.1 murein biosynthesis integral membrane protein MurJ [Anaerolineae bacterium]